MIDNDEGACPSASTPAGRSRSPTCRLDQPPAPLRRRMPSTAQPSRRPARRLRHHPAHASRDRQILAERLESALNGRIVVERARAAVDRSGPSDRIPEQVVD
jgi:hypothetical protein